MKKLIYILLVLMLFISSMENLYSQSGWNIQAIGCNFHKAFFKNQSTGWIVGNTGVILKTTNAGFNWFGLKCQTKEHLFCINFVDLQTGWIAGRQGTIYKTTDGGYNWSNQSYNTEKGFYSITFPTALTGWICGKSATSNILIKTTNGGISWFEQYLDSTNILLNDIQSIDANTAFMCGIRMILKTTNGGNNWNIKYYNHYSNIKSLFFTDISHGWACGSIYVGAHQNVILISTNSGDNWSLINSTYNNGGFEDIYITGVNNAYTCDGIGNVYKYNNGWSLYTVDPNILLYSINFINTTTGFVAGNYGKIAITTNAGVNWNAQIPGLKSTYTGIEKIQFLNSLTGWALGAADLFKTTNGGQIWFNLNRPSSSTYGIYFCDYNTGYISGISGFLMKTTNGGSNWISLTSGIIDDLNSISFVNPETGWVVGPYNNILKTTNGGLNWNLQIPFERNYLFDVKAFNQNRCYVAGGFYGNTSNFPVGIFLKTTNGGLNWSTIFIRDSIYFYAAEFITENTGWMVGSKQQIYKTTNSGLNWVNQSIGYGPKLYSVDFINNNIGYISGDSGIVLKTTNSGLNWVKQNSGFSVALKDIEFISQDTGYIAGGESIILKTNTGGGIISVENIQNEFSSFFSLSQNYPNPFNPSTTIRFSVPPSKGARGMMNVKIVVYDMLGREVEQLLNEERKPGSYEVNWDGSRFASGVYFYKLITDDYMETKKMVLIK